MQVTPHPLSSWKEWWHAEASSWLFVIRTVVAMLLALFVALRFDLSSPGSAAVTVSIIALPQAGQVLEKSFYRMLGTLFGAAVTLVLVAGFAQHRNTFILAVALWIGLCTTASAWFRGFQAYGWLLCGYTTCLIGFPAYMDAGNAFDIAVDRVTIVGVGILCAGAVNAVILPTRSTTHLVQSLRRSFVDFVAFLDVATGVGGAAEMRVMQLKFSRDLRQLETARASSFFEDPSSRIRSRRLSGYLGSFMIAAGRLHLLHRQLESLRTRGHNDILAALEPLLRGFRDALRIGTFAPTSALDAQPLIRQLDTVLETLPSPGNPSSLAPADAAWTEIAGVHVMLQEALQATRALVVSYADLHAPQGRVKALPTARLRFHSDALQAAASGVRAALVVVITCMFWIASAWPEGFSMTLIGVVGCALFSAVPNPARAALQMCAGFAIGLPAVLVCYSWVLPAASGFDMLTLGLMPFLVLGAWLMTRPGLVLMGSGYFLMLLTGLGLTGVMHYDFISMFNNLLGLFLGIGVATMSLAVLVPGDRTWRPSRAHYHLLGTLSMARRAPLTGLPQRFEAHVRDLTLQLIELRPPGYDTARDQKLGLLVLEGGDAILRIRRHLASVPELLQRELSSVLDQAVVVLSSRDASASPALDEAVGVLLAATGSSCGADSNPPLNDARLQIMIGLRSLRLVAEALHAT